MKREIHDLLDDIEIITKQVITKNKGITHLMNEWQDGKLDDLSFKEYLINHKDYLISLGQFEKHTLEVKLPEYDKPFVVCFPDRASAIKGFHCMSDILKVDSVLVTRTYKKDDCNSFVKEDREILKYLR